MYKLVVLDVDDTTVNSKNMLSKANKQAIYQAKAKGVQITLASGRMYQSMQNVANQLNINLPLISCNGALIRDKNNILQQEVLEENIAKAVINFFNQKERALQLYTNEGLYSKEKCVYTWYLEQAEGLNCSIIDDITYNNFYKNLLKALIRLQPKEVEQYRKELDEYFGDTISAALSHRVYIEITNTGINKGKAVATLANHLGIKQQEVIAIGDSPNDKSMLQWAGLGIAMGNAMPEVKEIADVVTANVEEDGVAKALAKYVL